MRHQSDAHINNIVDDFLARLTVARQWDSLIFNEFLNSHLQQNNVNIHSISQLYFRMMILNEENEMK